MQTVDQLCLGLVVYDDGLLAAVLVSPENGAVIPFNDADHVSFFLPLPQPSYKISAVLADRSVVPLGLKIHGNPAINWDALAQKAEQDRQDQRTRENEERSKGKQ